MDGAVELNWIELTEKLLLFNEDNETSRSSWYEGCTGHPRLLRRAQSETYAESERRNQTSRQAFFSQPMVSFPSNRTPLSLSFAISWWLDDWMHTWFEMVSIVFKFYMGLFVDLLDFIEVKKISIIRIHYYSLHKNVWIEAYYFTARWHNQSESYKLLYKIFF